MRLGVPIVSQLADTQEKNRLYDCVPASIASCLQYLTKKIYDGAAIKDTIYGVDYVGVTDPTEYIPYCKAQQILLKSIVGESAKELLASALAEIRNGHPVLLTEVDPYGPGTHMVVGCAVDEPPGTLTIMDPFIAQYITKPDTYWLTVLRTDSIFSLEKLYTVPSGWRDDETVLYGPNNIPVKMGFREWILIHPNWDNTDWPMQPEEHRNPLELSNPTLGEGTQQIFRMTVLEWTEKLGVFRAWPGPEILALRKKAGI